MRVGSGLRSRRYLVPVGANFAAASFGGFGRSVVGDGATGDRSVADRHMDMHRRARHRRLATAIRRQRLRRGAGDPHAVSCAGARAGRSRDCAHFATGRAYVTTNAINNMSALFAVGASAFGGPATDPAAGAFDLECARETLARSFGRVDLVPFSDVLDCTDIDDVVAYLTSMPPGDRATREQVTAVRGSIAREMAAAGGVFRVHRESGLLVAGQPLG